jgi:large subunit ribosomal protein L15
MPLQRRVPKRGFTNIFKKCYNIINVRDLSGFEANSNLDKESLIEAGLVRRKRDDIKLLGDGNISHAVIIKVSKVSQIAKEKIEAAGGKVEVI